MSLHVILLFLYKRAGWGDGLYSALVINAGVMVRRDEGKVQQLTKYEV